jgi:hypothetical protein
MTSPWSLLIPLVLLMPGCSKPRFTYEVDGSFRNTGYRTVAMDPRRDRVFIREGMRPLDPSLHVQAALAELMARNYQRVAASEADLWVAVYVLTEAPSEGGKGSSTKGGHREGSGEGRHGGGRGGTGGGGKEASSPHEAGNASRTNFTLIIQLHDRKSGLPVWQGEARLSHKDLASEGKPLSPEESVRQLLQPLQPLPNRP